jgi:hypothetical protein
MSKTPKEITLTEAQIAKGDVVRTLLYVGRCETKDNKIGFEYEVQDASRQPLIMGGGKIGKHEQPGSLLLVLLPTKDGGKTPSGSYTNMTPGVDIIALGKLADLDRVLELELRDDAFEQARAGAKAHKDKLTERVLQSTLEPLRSIILKTSTRERAALVARIIYLLTK